MITIHTRPKFIIFAIFLFIAVFFLGIFVGAHNTPAIAKVTSVINKEPGVETTADFDPFWRVWETIDEKSPSASTISDEDRVWGSIKGLVSSLNDPYSVFFSPEETKSFKDTISGSFGGIGIEIGMKDKVLTVIAPLKGTPAYKAGIKSGDKILKINDTVTADISIDQAVSMIKGDEGTSVTLTIYREGEDAPREVKIVRDEISIPTLDTEARKDGVFVVKFYSFDANASKLFADAMHSFIASGDKRLIIDLRGNPGGYLDAAVDTASWFLPAGDVIVRENFGTKAPEQVYRSRGYTGIVGKKINIILLVDGGSASAAEILAGALSEHGVASMVGEKTYGKGSVQELIDITPDTALKITVAKWLTPNGVSISEHGLAPTEVVPITEDDIAEGNDPQLERALELLK